MTEAFVFPLFASPRRQQPVSDKARSESTSGMTFAGVDAVEIVAPDQFSAALLQDDAAPLFRAEIVHDASRGQAASPNPSTTGGRVLNDAVRGCRSRE